MPIDDRTPGRSYQLPSLLNLLVEDLPRLRSALAAIDADITARPTLTEVNQLIGNLIAGSPGALDTLNELAAAMGNDPNFAATIATQLGLKANLADVWTRAQADARYVTGSTQVEMVFIATEGQSAFTLTTPVINKPSALVSVGGVIQPGSEYSLNTTGTVLTLSEGVPVGTIVRVLALGIASVNVPPLDSVTEPMLRNGAVTPAKLSQPLTVRPALQAAGAVMEFTEIPNWARRITVTLQDFSTNGTAQILFRLGTATGFETSGYFASASYVTGANSCGLNSYSTGFGTAFASASSSINGTIVFTQSTQNLWICSGVLSDATTNFIVTASGAKALSGALDRVRITTTDGLSIFDSGFAGIMFEG